MHARHAPLLAALAALSALPARAAGAPGAQGGPTPGAAGLGDPYYPTLGNGGYDALHYDLRLAIDVETGSVEGALALRARATQALSSFNLDFLGPAVQGVEVDGQGAAFARNDGELVITPKAPLALGQEFTAGVRYAGLPSRVVDAGVPFIKEGIGWLRLPDKTIVVMSEPSGARGFVPCNDHPLDKATWTITLVVDEPWVAAANGVLADKQTADGKITSRFEMDDPMATYLATVCVGDFDVETGEGPNGLPLTHYFYKEPDAKQRELARRGFARTAEQVAFFSEIFGPYPFDSFGGVLIKDGLGGALETQTLVVYTGGADEGTIAHELAHQWTGNSVSPASWEHLWLNEGFATYAEWLWREHDKGTEAYMKRVGHAYRAVRTMGPPGSTGPVIFKRSVYERGAWTLHALRAELGDETFFKVLRAWPERHKGGVVTTADFRALCEELSQRELGAFFQAWVYDERCPVVPEFEPPPEEKAAAKEGKPPPEPPEDGG